MSRFIKKIPLINALIALLIILTVGIYNPIANIIILLLSFISVGFSIYRFKILEPEKANKVKIFILIFPLVAAIYLLMNMFF
ncbi:hypothetical protein CHU92_08310 [Flavobacterium cyanobacteriorum]|uniref:Phosphatidate cytidylyltransferase n=1 Tax=Flavobacterium cyanobacteriorum TaxID=2022802 RepID=A0A255Z7R8_9FLAO|nr:hypothetical protein CHU92_08310 [Flavobacterium cyanobacteriorum]